LKAWFLWERLVAAMSAGIAATSRSHRLVISTGLNGFQLLNLHEYNMRRMIFACLATSSGRCPPSILCDCLVDHHMEQREWK
jgi:hypothetical protein